MTEPRSRADRLDRLLSVAAGIGAVCAVAVSLYQAALAREQQRASAWPYLVQQNSHVTGQPYTRQVENAGIGPARVRSFTVLVDGQPVHGWGAAVRALTGEPDSGLVYSTLGRGSVIPPGAGRTLLRLPPGEQARRFWVGAQTRLTTVVCYCSVYDECWQADSRQDREEPPRVKACVRDTVAEFER